MKYLLACILSLFVLWSQAQTSSVSGKIVDSRNRGIPEVLVYLQELPELRTKTNLDGEFSLNLPAERSLQLNIIYASEKIEIPLFLLP
jgi:hypothetical protein